jgi:hypothetical protein
MFKDKLLSLFVKMHTATLRRESGQGALEYIAIVIGLVVLVYAGFRIAGVNIFDKASSFVDSVLSGS